MDSILSEMLFIVLLAGVILFKVTPPYRWKNQYKQAIGTHSKVTTTV